VPRCFEKSSHSSPLTLCHNWSTAKIVSTVKLPVQKIVLVFVDRGIHENVVYGEKNSRNNCLKQQHFCTLTFMKICSAVWKLHWKVPHQKNRKCCYCVPRSSISPEVLCGSGPQWIHYSTEPTMKSTESMHVMVIKFLLFQFLRGGWSPRSLFDASDSPLSNQWHIWNWSFDV